MDRCLICGKPTKSHELDGKFICHSCWIEKPEIVEKIKKGDYEESYEGGDGEEDEDEEEETEKTSEKSEDVAIEMEGLGKSCIFCGETVGDMIEHLEKYHPLAAEMIKREAIRRELEEKEFTNGELFGVAEDMMERAEPGLAQYILKQVDPSCSWLHAVYNLLSKASLTRRNHLEAEHFAKKALEQEPDSELLRLELAIAYFFTSKHYLAYEIIEDIEKDSLNQEISPEVGALHTHIKDTFQETAEDFDLTEEELYEFDKKISKCDELVDKGKYEEAKRGFEDLIELYPEMVSPYYDLGVLHQRLDEPEKAKKYFEKTLSLDPDHRGAEARIEETEDQVGKWVPDNLLATDIFSEEEKELIPERLLHKDSEEAKISMAFYRIKNHRRVKGVLRNSEEFEIIEEEKNFVEARWVRKISSEKPYEGTNLEFEDLLEKYEKEIGYDPSEYEDDVKSELYIGSVELFLNELFLHTESIGRLKILENLLLDKKSLGDSLELDERYFIDQNQDPGIIEMSDEETAEEFVEEFLED